MAIRQDNMATVQKWGEALPKGTYHVRVSKGEEATSESGNPIYNLHMVVQEEPYVGRVIFDPISLQAHALSKLKAYYEAVDYNPGPEGHDPDTLIGREFFVTVDTDVYQGVTRNKVPPYGPRSIMKGKPTSV